MAAVAALTGCGGTDPAPPAPSRRYVSRAAAYGVPRPDPERYATRRAEALCTTDVLATARQIIGQVTRNQRALLEGYCPDVADAVVGD